MSWTDEERAILDEIRRTLIEEKLEMPKITPKSDLIRQIEELCKQHGGDVDYWIGMLKKK